MSEKNKDLTNLLEKEELNDAENDSQDISISIDDSDKLIVDSSFDFSSIIEKEYNEIKRRYEEERKEKEALAEKLAELLKDKRNRQDFASLSSVYASIFANPYTFSEVKETKYKDWTFRDIIKQFDRPDFLKLPKEDIVALCSEVNQKIAKKLKIQPSVVNFKRKLFNFDQTQMECFVSKNQIDIIKQSKKHMAYGYSYLFYILHETYHSYQFQQIERMKNNLPYDNSCVIGHANDTMNFVNFSFIKNEIDEKEKERKKRAKEKEKGRKKFLKEKEQRRKKLLKEQKQESGKPEKENFLEDWFEKREQKRKKKYERKMLECEKKWEEQERKYTKDKVYAINLDEISANLFAYNMMDKLFERKYLTNEQAHEYNFAKMNWCLSIQKYFDEIGFDAVRKRTLKNFRTLEKSQQTFEEFLPETTNHNYGIFFDVENQYNINNYFDKLYSDICKIQMRERIKTRFVEGMTIDEYTKLSNCASKNEIRINYVPLEKIRNKYYLFMDKHISVPYGRDLEEEFGGNFELMENVDFKKEMKKKKYLDELDEQEDLKFENIEDASSKEDEGSTQTDNLKNNNLIEKLKNKFFKTKDGKIVEEDKNLEKEMER